MPVISIITPYYNTPATLFEACARSVLEQPFEDFEWIIVDDGSREEHRRFLTKFAIENANVVLIQQDNSGVSAARNTALEAMDCRYFTFLDSDDFFTPSFLIEAIDTMESTGADIAYGILKREDDTSLIGTDNSNMKLELLENDRLKTFRRGQLAGERLHGIAEIRKFAPYTIAPKVYRASSFSDLRFAVGMPIGEDSLFNAMALASATRLALVPSVWYTYVSAPNSASRRPDETKMLNDLLGFENFFLHASHYEWEQTDVAMRYIHTVINMLSELAPHLSLHHLATFAKKAMQLPPARWNDSIKISDYLVSRRFKTLALSLTSGHFHIAAAMFKSRSTITFLRSTISHIS